MTLPLIAKWNALSAAEKRDVLLWGTRTPSAKHKRDTLAVCFIAFCLAAPAVANVLL